MRYGMVKRNSNFFQPGHIWNNSILCTQTLVSLGMPAIYCSLFLFLCILVQRDENSIRPRITVDKRAGKKAQRKVENYVSEAVTNKKCCCRCRISLKELIKHVITSFSWSLSWQGHLNAANWMLAVLLPGRQKPSIEIFNLRVSQSV